MNHGVFKVRPDSRATMLMWVNIRRVINKSGLDLILKKSGHILSGIKKILSIVSGLTHTANESGLRTDSSGNFRPVVFALPLLSPAPKEDIAISASFSPLKEINIIFLFRLAHEVQKIRTGGVAARTSANRSEIALNIVYGAIGFLNAMISLAFCVAQKAVREHKSILKQTIFLFPLPQSSIRVALKIGTPLRAV